MLKKVLGALFGSVISISLMVLVLPNAKRFQVEFIIISIMLGFLFYVISTEA